MKRSISVFLLLLLLSGCGREQDVQEDSVAVGKLRWRQFPVSLRVDEALLDRGSIEDDLLAAVRFWERRAGKVLFALGSWRDGVNPFVGDPADPSDLIENVIFFQNPWPHGERIAGKTFLYGEDNFTRRAGIFLNGGTDLCSGLCLQEPTRTSRRKLLAHELGHFLGLQHVDRRENVMFPEILPGGELDALEVDLKQLHKQTL